MSKKLIHFASFILVVGLCGSFASGQENQIINGEFDEGFDPWGLYTYQNTAEGFTVEVVQGAGLSGENAAMFDITNSSALASIGIARGDLVMDTGVTYPIGFTARAEQDRGMVVLLQANINDASWPTYLEQTVALTTSPQDYVIEYTHSGGTVGAAEGENLILYLMIKGPWWQPPGAGLNGKVWIDRVYFGAQTPRQPVYHATNPSLPDGAVHLDIWVKLEWSPGDFATSHNVYLGDNFDDVNNGTGGTFQGNHPTTSFTAGFLGPPYPDGLIPGTTYYWRIDEVNNLNANSPWKGNVWSFTVPPKKAYEPDPADGVKFIEPDATLSWIAGFGAALHHVYFGDNSGDVEAGAGGTYKGLFPTTSFVPGTLEREKTYYWRIDEFDGAATYIGDVWSFTVAREGGGLKAEYFNNTILSGEPVLTRLEPEIDFSWGNGDNPGVNSPAEGVNVNDFSARWSGELEVDLTDTYTFHITANNGFRLWLNGRLIIDFWDNPTTDSLASEPVELVGGDTYSIRMEYFEGEDAATARLFWESSTREQQIIPSGALQFPLKASAPSPANGATGVRMTSILGWKPGDYAASHEIYFGTDANTVKNAATASPEYKDTTALGDESFEPEKLAWNSAYYWRVDEVNNLHPDSPWAGSIWSLRTGDFLVVDNFEDYDTDNAIWANWHDGLGYVDADGVSHPGNGTGSEVGDANTVSYTEEGIVNSGRQSMPCWYDNNKPDKMNYSEAKLTLSDTRDWTEEGVKALSLSFYGDPCNAPERMYVAVANSTGTPVVVYHDDPGAAQIDTWTEWNIDLKEFQDKGVNLTNVNSIGIGFGNRNNPQSGGAGKMYFDDLRLYRSRCSPDKVTLSQADLNSDCVVDYRDLEIMVGDWLAGDPGLAGDLNADDTVDFKDYAVLADQWLEGQLWPQP
ncbi:MAG: PA14 domain-containing protein [Planctomycetota bacterium]|jgi:hypothetical protein